MEKEYQFEIDWEDLSLHCRRKICSDLGKTEDEIRTIVNDFPIGTIVINWEREEKKRR